jgi:alpha-ketoglutarate-dependent taurine dioxygenase
MADVRLENLSPALGVEVHGVDLSKPLDDAVVQALRQAYQDRLLLLFRGQHLSPENHVRAAGLFGPVLDEFADGSSHSLVSNLDRKAYIGGVANDQELSFHSDYTNTDSPIWGLSLYSIEVSANAPVTRFVNAQRAYEHLPPDLREKFDGLSVTDAYEADAYADPAAPDADRSMLSGLLFTHPAVIDHPRNGRRQIFCNHMWTHCIVGMDATATRALLDPVFGVMYARSNMYEHRWADGDLIIWDNIALQHARDPVPADCRRHLRRVPIGQGTPQQAEASRRARDYVLDRQS